MAGIYIHIPFCKKICYYCDFYKSANFRYVDDFFKALVKEISFKSNFVNEQIETIYFGGGTPSSVSLSNIELTLKKLYQHFPIVSSPEITFEINPDDVDLAYLRSLRAIGINRLSIGVQSFNNSILTFLHRRHNAEQSINVISDSVNAGFKNISIDLIYGIPNQKLSDFENDLKIFKSFNLSHLSAYHLSIEEKTHFGRMLKKGVISEINDTESSLFYNKLIKFMKLNDYVHYEISSFALASSYSKHNTSYWQNVPYIGFGPSAHSYDGNYRYWNISSVKEYIVNIELNKPYFESEKLDRIDKFNEYIITGLRTKWGCDLYYIKNYFDISFYEHCMKILNNSRDQVFIIGDDRKFSLSEEALFKSDFYIEKFIFEK